MNFQNNYHWMRVIQERAGNNTPTVRLASQALPVSGPKQAVPLSPQAVTRGSDLSGSLEGAGGIGGMLARSHGYSGGNWSTHNFYHADGNGNVTYLVNSSQGLAASYRYDPYGNLISQSGTLAFANVYRFSSKEIHWNSGFYYYGYRWYAPNLQRWLNRDPIAEIGGINLYQFTANNPVDYCDLFGLDWFPALPPSKPFYPPNLAPRDTGRQRERKPSLWPKIRHGISEGSKYLGMGGKCCNKSGSTEWWLDNSEWKPLLPGDCTGFFDDCDGFTCSGKFYKIGGGESAECKCNGNGGWGDGTYTIQPFHPPWSPGSGFGTPPWTPELPPDYVWPM